MSGLSIQPLPATAVALTGGLLALNEVPRPPELAVSWVVIFAATSAVFWTLFAVHASFWWVALPAALLAAAGAAALVAIIPDARGAWTPLHLIAVLAIGAWAATSRRAAPRGAVSRMHTRPRGRSRTLLRSDHDAAA
ncbi:MAG: hypothetical protein ACXIUP_01105 [Microcella sp.]